MDTYRFFWIANKMQYIKEAVHSAKSVQKYHPDAELVLFTNDGRAVSKEMNIFTNIYMMEPMNSKYWFLESVHFMNYAMMCFQDGDRAIYLDTDTHVCAPLDNIFNMLAPPFDFVGAHAPGRQTAPTVEPIPDSFPEWNIGVQGIFVSERMRYFIAFWLKHYRKHHDIYRNNDQASLREIMWNYQWDLNFATLPTEYNFRFQMGGQVRETVRVLHGRSNDYEALEKIVNPGGRMIRAWKNGELK